jgi:hypothetical protein
LSAAVTGSYVDADHGEIGEVFVSLLRHAASPDYEFARKG